jgi:FtsP/CotA-like multicopper oxidase with cupredoxin domain
MVNISGAVANAGLYSLPPGSRVNDAIRAAGGFSDLANTTGINQTTIPQANFDPLSELLAFSNGAYIATAAPVPPALHGTIADGTQLWKITHNGVDTHFIHFHLFNVQVINRVGWDGSLRQPDANEVGWKDTVQMNPGEVTIIRIRFLQQNGAAYPFDPTQGPGYVWHCHIVDHEDNEMMRPYQVVP